MQTCTGSTQPIQPLPRNAEEMAGIMREFRERTKALVVDLSDQQMIGPQIAIVNPPLWEIGHVAWSQEFWTLRRLRKEQPLLANSDQLYNSTDVAHDTRWGLNLPSRADTLRYMDEVLEKAIARIAHSSELSGDEFYFYWLVTFHEAMHAEALAYTRQTLGYPAPPFLVAKGAAQSPRSPARTCTGDVAIPTGEYVIGATRDYPFVFDNEKWAHPVKVNSFRIARAPVTNGEFLAFVENGGYRDKRYWSEDGWNWLKSGGNPRLAQSFALFFKKNMSKDQELLSISETTDHPLYWRRDGAGRWQQRIFDGLHPLNPNLPVLHVNWYEAEAYCNWVGRRLPSEAEWEIAASGAQSPAQSRGSAGRTYFPWGDLLSTAGRANLDWHAGGPVEVEALEQGDSAFGCRQMIGNVWEWTATDFQPYPGFSVDPYQEYSKPWFGTHKVLRGGCWATSSLLIRNTWRNFYTPDRRDVWAGFRTCAT